MVILTYSSLGMGHGALGIGHGEKTSHTRHISLVPLVPFPLPPSPHSGNPANAAVAYLQSNHPYTQAAIPLIMELNLRFPEIDRVIVRLDDLETDRLNGRIGEKWSGLGLLLCETLRERFARNDSKYCCLFTEFVIKGDRTWQFKRKN
ncbi:hypothetical protein NIES2100_60690 [Calothrix sp. NIES-2100]|uniref:hypothetical protein n=1 Tax=Calothrix sp. NIES-2100 TaxID=1954172 RepID=UPI000B5F4503|nr:hypothetical protein NIES2100_60690 [Calothrix sp. NIES-2100]